MFAECAPKERRMMMSCFKKLIGVLCIFSMLCGGIGVYDVEADESELAKISVTWAEYYQEFDKKHHVL